jgi:predicted metal-dependent enzyme (double-stranded beta helix superfamily)
MEKNFEYDTTYQNGIIHFRISPYSYNIHKIKTLGRVGILWGGGRGGVWEHA